MYIDDGFLPRDSEVLMALRDRSLWLDFATEDYLAFNPQDEEPINEFEILIQTIFGDVHFPVTFEYWINHATPDNNLGWHQDKNEREYNEEGTTKCPLFGAVYYGYPHRLRGGYLEISKSGDLEPATTERIEPLYNRLVVFDPSQWHRVSDIEEGERFGFQVNVWRTGENK